MNLAEKALRQLSNVLDETADYLLDGHNYQERDIMREVDRIANPFIRGEDVSLKDVYDGLARIEENSPIPGFAKEYCDFLFFKMAFDGPGEYMGRVFTPEECHARPWGELTLYSLPKKLSTFNAYRKLKAEYQSSQK